MRLRNDSDQECFTGNNYHEIKGGVKLKYYWWYVCYFLHTITGIDNRIDVGGHPKPAGLTPQYSKHPTELRCAQTTEKKDLKFFYVLYENIFDTDIRYDIIFNGNSNDSNNGDKMINLNLKARMQSGGKIQTGFFRFKKVNRVGLKTARQLFKMLKTQKIQYSVNRVSFSNLTVNY